MKQREVQDDENVRWTCVQALAGGSGATAEQAEEKLQDAEGAVPVVCTPSGGAQSVRVALQPGWEDALPDDALLAAIAEARQG